MFTTVILAGGRAIRMGDRCKKTPKPMLIFGGTPFLIYKVSWLYRIGCPEIIIVTGHLSSVIETVLGTTAWKKRGVRIVKEDEPRGTAVAARTGIAHATKSCVLLCNGDTVAEFDALNAVGTFRGQSLPTMALVTLTQGVQNQGAILVQNGIVVAFQEGRESLPVGPILKGFRGSSTGSYIGEKMKMLEVLDGHNSLEREVLPALVSQRQLAGALFGDGRLIDFGIPERYQALQSESQILCDIYGPPLI